MAPSHVPKCSLTKKGSQRMLATVGGRGWESNARLVAAKDPEMFWRCLPWTEHHFGQAELLLQLAPVLPPAFAGRTLLYWAPATSNLNGELTSLKSLSESKRRGL